MSTTPDPHATPSSLASGVAVLSPHEWQIWLDRAVDGELSSAEEQQLLRQLDRQPERWRACALAFWEAKTWHRYLGAVCHQEPPTPPTNPMAVAAKFTAGTAIPATQETTRPVSPPASLSSAPRTRGWYVGGTLAAALLVAFTLGAVTREYVPGARGQWFANLVSPAVISPPAVSGQPDANPVDTNSPFPAPERMQFQLVDQSGRLPPQNFDIPIIKVDSINPQSLRNWQHISHIPALESPLIDELSKAGYQVEQKNFFYLKVLPDGRQILVPFQHTQVIPKTTCVL
ncbi:MAG: hypothetical protein SFX18_07380 [Pirellulales bacterium]|nr:hypothetical protein [Pirellulales bacterium]